jgi:uncharacterized protein YbaA (DUF1428 family)
VLPVPTTGKQAFLEHARAVNRFFFDYGAIRVVECWADDVSDGKVTDFRRAVQATAEECVAFSWIEWPDKATRDAGLKTSESNAEMMALPMPFDGKRMIYGGFTPMIDARAEVVATATSYIDGFVTPVTPANRDAYLALERRMATKFHAVGAHRFAEHWGDDVPDGKVTDFKRAVQATGDEVAVFCWFEWPDKPTRDAGWAKMMADPDMQPDRADMPFDGKRMIYGGFVPVYDVGEKQ